MVEKGQKLRSISTGKLYVVTLVKVNTLVLEAVEGGEQILTGVVSLVRLFQEEEDRQ